MWALRILPQSFLFGLHSHEQCVYRRKNESSLKYLSGPLKTVGSNDRDVLLESDVAIDLMPPWFSGCPRQELVA